MRYIIIDLEATCWERGVSRAQMETIEIGAVRLESSSGPPADTFAAFVRPVASPVLSAFCTQLTSIRQEDVDGAAFFGSVLWDLLAWAGDEPFWLCSWGAYDLGQLRADCERHSMVLPEALERHINLKKHFGRLYGCGPVGMAGRCVCAACRLRARTTVASMTRATSHGWPCASCPRLSARA